MAGMVLLFQVNTYRADHKLPPLTISPQTCVLAMERLGDMKKEWSHKGFYRRLNESFFDGGYWGENLARYGMTPEETVSAWDASPLHKANLLTPMDEGCIATDGTYWVLELHQSNV